MAGIALLGVAAGMLYTVFAITAGQYFGADVRQVLFEQVQSFSFGNLDKLDSGTLITRLTNDVNQVQEVMMMLLRVMVRVLMLLVGSLIMAIITSPQLALLFVPLLPFVAAVLIWIINKSYPLYGEVQRRLDALNTVLQENLAGVRVVKAFARMSHERERFAEANTTLMDRNIKAARLGVITMPVLMMALNTGVVASLWFGGIQVSQGTLQTGQVLAFVNYLMQTLMALMAVSMLIVRVSRPEASDEAVVAAAKAAQADDFIRSFPDGYDTLVGQRGVNLSGGQKQRMAIARALLTEPAVLILDDSTSAVDVQTESKIQDALFRQKPNQTRIVVAQRISTVVNADQILVLDEGRLVAQDTHIELLATSPIYREIYESQLTNQVVAHVG